MPFERLQLEGADQLAARDELGEHHGDGLQRLDLVLGVVALRAVLHDQHAEHAAAAQDRHAHQRVVDLLAGLRPVGEIGMRLRVGQRQRPRGGGDDADQALADAQPGAVHRLGPQALGGEELQHLAGAHDVAGADLRHHVGGDDVDDLVEPLLRRARAGHGVAQPAQQAAGAGGRRARLHQLPARERPPSCGGTLAVPVARERARRPPAPPARRGSRAVDCSRVTMPTLWPAITEPVSTSPSITARRSAPAQKCSISSCASFCDSSPRLKRVDDVALQLEEFPACRHWRARAPGSPGSARRAATDGTASRAPARMKACLKRGWAIDSWAQTKRVPSCTPAAPISR